MIAEALKGTISALLIMFGLIALMTGHSYVAILAFAVAAIAHKS